MDGDGEHEKLGSEVNRVIARPRGMHNLKSQDFCLCIRRGGGGVTSYVLEKCDKAHRIGTSPYRKRKSRKYFTSSQQNKE